MDHVATMRRCYELLNAGDFDGFADYLADDLVEHETSPGLEPTKEGVVQFFTSYRAAFPDLRFEPEDFITEGDKIVARGRLSGTFTGEFLGMSPTGRSFDVEIIDIVRFGDDGRALEHWGLSDVMTMMQQLGVVPAPDEAPA